MNNSDPIAFGADARVRIVEQRPRGQLKNREYVAVLDEDLRVDPSMLQKYCFSSPTIGAIDLVTVLAAVRFADRAVQRHHSVGWARKIDLEVPVYDYAKWSAESLSNKLQQCLSYLTGDFWTIEFSRRKKASRLISPGQIDHLVSLPEAPYVGVPYSDGLDSYGQAKLIIAREPNVHLICTYTDYKGGLKSWDAFCKTRNAELENLYSIPIPFQVVEPHHAESSFRSRPFIFYSLAAYGSILAGSSRVLIPENGQGSIGGSLVLLGNEAPHRSCYPGFLMRLRTVLSHLFEREISFEHPALLQTKGQVLAALSEIQSPSIWSHKWSCSHDQRHSSQQGKRVHCGVCGGCVLRRVSMHSAGLSDPTKYLFSNLTAPNLETAVEGHVRVKAIAAMQDVARNSVRDMHRLAKLALTTDSRLEEVALDISDTNGMLASEALEGVRRLLANHAQEWGEFLSFCGRDSWVSGFARG